LGGSEDLQISFLKGTQVNSEHRSQISYSFQVGDNLEATLNDKLILSLEMSTSSPRYSSVLPAPFQGQLGQGLGPWPAGRGEVEGFCLLGSLTSLLTSSLPSCLALIREEGKREWSRMEWEALCSQGPAAVLFFLKIFFLTF
jgi:hypothetical protein